MKELAATDTPLIGFAGAPFTVASYLVEGAPTRDFAVIKSLMHADPVLFDRLLDRLVTITISFLRAQVAHGARAVQLFDSWAGSLTRDEYQRFALPATTRVLEGVADLDVPTILFGVGTGELLDLMSRAGSSVVGIDWHVDLDEGRRRVGNRPVQGNLDPARCLGGVRLGVEAAREVLAARGRRRRAHLQPRPRRAAVHRPRRPRGGRAGRARRGTGGRAVKTGVLVMAYGTPTTPDDVEAYYTRIRHGRAPTPELLADLVRRYNAIGGTSPLAQRTADQVAGIARGARGDESRATSTCVSGRSTSRRLLEETAESFARDGFTKVVGLVLAPHSSSMSTEQYMARARAALGDAIDFVAIGAWYDAPGFLELIAQRVNEALELVPASRRATTEVLFSAHSLPEKILASGDDYPDQLLDSAAKAAALADVTSWDVAWQSAGRTPEPWIGPDILQVLRDKRALGVTDVVSCPIGFVADHLEVLFDIDVEARGVAHEIGLNLVRTRVAQRRPRIRRDPRARRHEARHRWVERRSSSSEVASAG